MYRIFPIHTIEPPEELSMKKSVTVCAASFLLLFICSNTVFSQSNQSKPPRLKRADSFFGIHFDFHAGDDCTEIGKNVSREMVQYIIDTVKPDYIQCDCKGHRGLSSYPTNVGNQAPGFAGEDPLKIWREVTAKNGIALYMHYSGVWDTEAVRKHPEWARINEDGKPDGRLTSVYGPYVDELLIPQVHELASVYDVDGIWIDGECWAVERDYHPDVMKKFTAETGISAIPKSPDDPYWYEWSQFNRDGFRAYFNHYVTGIHRNDPGFQVASNWAYSSLMPEPVTVDIDFISGDFSPLNSINTARYDGRCMMHQGKPWDLMAWSFTVNWSSETSSRSTKTDVQLKQEAASVLALGGGFQAYFKQDRDGSVFRWPLPIMSEVARFCREREEFCHKAESVPQVGLIYSTHALYRINKKLFASYSGEVDALKGNLQCLLDSQQAVDIVSEHHLTGGKINEFPLLVYPEWEYVEPGFKAELLDYVKNGGNLLIIGPKAAANFEKELGVTLNGEASQEYDELEHDGILFQIVSQSQEAVLGKSTRRFGTIYTDWRKTKPGIPAASIRSYGKGKIAAVYIGLGERYIKSTGTVPRDFMESLVDELFPDPVVDIQGTHFVDVTLMRKDGTLMVNLVNTSGPHADDEIYIYDTVPPVGPVTVSVVYPNRPSAVVVQPGNRNVSYNYLNGKVVLTLPSVELHDIIVIE